MWMQNFTVSYGNNIEELDTKSTSNDNVITKIVCTFCRSSPKTSLVFMCVCERAWCTLLLPNLIIRVFPFYASIFHTLLPLMQLLLPLQLFYESVSCVHGTANMKLCKHNQIDVLLFVLFRSLAVTVIPWQQLFVCLFVWMAACLNVCVCAYILICSTQFSNGFCILQSLSFYLFVVVFSFWNKVNGQIWTILRIKYIAAT